MLNKASALGMGVLPCLRLGLNQGGRLVSACLYGYTDNMNKSITVSPKKRGRPATGRDPLVGTRFPPDLLASIEAYAQKHDVPRSEAIRRLVVIGLDVEQKAPR